jgi:hypothetical protein
MLILFVFTYLHARVDVRLDDEMKMINEIDLVDDELNANERYSDERIMDHHNIHFVNDLNIPIEEKKKGFSKEILRKNQN